VLLKNVDLLIGFRVAKDDEIEGLDLRQHGEEGYKHGSGFDTNRRFCGCGRQSPDHRANAQD